MRRLLVPLLLFSPAAAEVVAAEAVPRGTVLTEAHLEGPRTEVEGFVGLEARRPLFSGRTVRSGDLQAPRAVRRQQAVSVRFVRGSLVLRTEGRAMGAGAVGDSVDVLLAGRRMPISATITGPGRVEVSS